MFHSLDQNLDNSNHADWSRFGLMCENTLLVKQNGVTCDRVREKREGCKVKLLDRIRRRYCTQKSDRKKQRCNTENSKGCVSDNTDSSIPRSRSSSNCHESMTNDWCLSRDATDDSSPCPSSSSWASAPPNASKPSGRANGSCSERRRGGGIFRLIGGHFNCRSSGSESTNSILVKSTSQPPPYEKARSSSHTNLSHSQVMPSLFPTQSASASEWRSYSERLVDDSNRLISNGHSKSPSTSCRTLSKNVIFQTNSEENDEYAVRLRTKSTVLNDSTDKRHTVNESFDPSRVKHNRILQEERDLMMKGKETCVRLINWYQERLTNLEIRRKLLNKTMIVPFDVAVHQERYECLRTQIIGLNRRMIALMDSSEKAFPSHMNQESQRIMDQPIEDQYCWLKRQNLMLTDEVTEKTQRIAILEHEKAKLIQDPFGGLLDPNDRSYRKITRNFQRPPAYFTKMININESNKTNFRPEGQNQAYATLM